MAADPPELTVADAGAWRRWLDSHGENEGGVWLVLAKKGTTRPTSLTYEQALEEALCHGWVDGQIGRGDEATFRRRFTPRRPSSSWSERNVTLVDSLTAAGRMRPAGLRAVERARADGTWDAAYPGQAAAAVPDDLLAALAAEPDARATFDSLNRANRYAVLYRIATATRRDTRARRIDDLVAMLARGEAFHPQKGLRRPSGAGRRPRR